MCKVKAKINAGPIESERLARIATVDGKSVEVIVAKTQVISGAVYAAEIGRKNNQVLVELPRETTAGYWRIWVNKAAVL